MKPFVPATITLEGRVRVAATLEVAFPLFSPEGEKLWVPGWSPEMLFPPAPGWTAGQIFRTREETGEAVWLITGLDREDYRVEYHRIEPSRYVARIEVACRAVSGRETDVRTTYSFIGLTESGNREIAAMTQQAYDAKMARWAEWIRSYLEARG